MNIVLDTNVIISSLIRDSITRHLIVSLDAMLYYPETALEEIVRNKNEILEKSGLQEEDFNILLATLFRYVHIIKTEEFAIHLKKADSIIGKIHKNDVQFVAAALAKDAIIWSNDDHFRKQNSIKIIGTSELIGK
jgi:predicted nucleic acid-binding protein